MKLKKILLVCLFSVTAFAAHADEAAKAKITQWMKKNGIPGAAVEIYSHGKQTSYYLGYANRETKQPVTQDTIFEIASLTKIFTTLLLANELMSGAMKLSDPISLYVPDLPASSSNKLNQITLENLATHTSGLPFNVPKRINSRKKLTTFFARWKNPSTVGSAWLYSNVNMGLLGFSLEKQHQQSIYELYHDKILQPLGMNSSGSMIPDKLEYRYAQGYNMAGNPAPRRNKTVWINPPNSDWIFPATGSLKSTGHDMSLFLKAALRAPGTPDFIANAMQVTQTTYVQTSRFQQGLAWIIHPDPIKNKTKLLSATPRSGPFPANQKAPHFNGNALMEKTGSSGGFRSYIAVIPDQEIGVVLLVNRYITSTELIRMGRAIALNQ